jgi:hypothetical protein
MLENTARNFEEGRTGLVQGVAVRSAEPHGSSWPRADAGGLGVLPQLVAATLGREFTFELLKAVSPLEEKILERELTQLEAGLLYQQGVLQQATGRLRNQ